MLYQIKINLFDDLFHGTFRKEQVNSFCLAQLSASEFSTFFFLNFLFTSTLISYHFRCHSWKTEYNRCVFVKHISSLGTLITPMPPDHRRRRRWRDCSRRRRINCAPVGCNFPKIARQHVRLPLPTVSPQFPVGGHKGMGKKPFEDGKEVAEAVARCGASTKKGGGQEDSN